MCVRASVRVSVYIRAEEEGIYIHIKTQACHFFHQYILFDENYE